MSNKAANSQTRCEPIHPALPVTRTFFTILLPLANDLDDPWVLFR